jgi:hypothetical protein
LKRGIYGRFTRLDRELTASFRVLAHTSRARSASPKDPELDMDVPFLLLTAFLAAITIGLIYGFERLRGGKK